LYFDGFGIHSLVGDFT